MSVLTNSGRVAIAEAIKEQPLHLGWGIGDGSWTVPPAEDVTADALTNEVGRRVIFQKEFCVPDGSGPIIVPTGQFAFSTEPTNNLYLSYKFDFTDAESATIRELGVFSGTELKTGVDVNKQYLDFLADLEKRSDDATKAIGILLLLEHTAPIHRNNATRETFEFVITF
jgi:hypothetical protein